MQGGGHLDNDKRRGRIMRSFVICSLGERIGKTFLCVGVARNLRNVGYFRPIKENIIHVGGRLMEEDARLMKSILGYEIPEDVLSPLDYFSGEFDKEKLLRCFAEAGRGKEVMLVEAPKDFFTGFSAGISAAELARELDAEVILLARDELQDIDRILSYKFFVEKVGAKFRGVILNMVRREDILRLLEGVGVRVLGRIPYESRLSMLRVSEIAEQLDAKVVAGETGMSNMVENVLVGAMSPENAIKYFRRVPRKAVITGGDRSDIQLCALSTPCSCLILTGGRYPAAHVVSTAEERGVPLLLTELDTFSAAERIENMVARLRPEDIEKIKLAEELIKENVRLEEAFF